jgi:hypothetical protein
MKHNILGGLVIFVVVVTCLLMLDDISHPPQDQTTVETTEATQAVDNESPNDLAIIEIEE